MFFCIFHCLCLSVDEDVSDVGIFYYDKWWFLGVVSDAVFCEFIQDQ